MEIAIAYSGIKGRIQWSQAGAFKSQKNTSCKLCIHSCFISKASRQRIPGTTHGFSVFFFQFQKHNINWPNVLHHSGTEAGEGQAEQCLDCSEAVIRNFIPQPPLSVKCWATLPATEFQHSPGLCWDSSLENFPAVFLARPPGLAAWKTGLFILNHFRINIIERVQHRHLA